MNLNNLPVQTELMDQIVALRHQVFTLLLVLVVVSGTLTVVCTGRPNLPAETLQSSTQATQIIAAFKRDLPLMENFVKQLTAYGVTHPDFQPISKIGIVATQPAATPVVPAKSSRYQPRAAIRTKIRLRDNCFHNRYNPCALPCAADG